jgi:hypothetical protein
MKEYLLANCTWIRGLKFNWAEGRQESVKIGTGLYTLHIGALKHILILM